MADRRHWLAAGQGALGLIALSALLFVQGWLLITSFAITAAWQLGLAGFILWRGQD